MDNHLGTFQVEYIQQYESRTSCSTAAFACLVKTRNEMRKCEQKSLTAPASHSMGSPKNCLELFLNALVNQNMVEIGYGDGVKRNCNCDNDNHVLLLLLFDQPPRATITSKK